MVGDLIGNHYWDQKEKSLKIIETSPPILANSPRNRSVLVWGFGNAAHETARELQKFTQDCFENCWGFGIQPDI